MPGLGVSTLVNIAHGIVPYTVALTLKSPRALEQMLASFDVHAAVAGGHRLVRSLGAWLIGEGRTLVLFGEVGILQHRLGRDGIDLVAARGASSLPGASAPGDVQAGAAHGDHHASEDQQHIERDRAQRDEEKRE